MKNTEFMVNLGRLNPIHLGHEEVIKIKTEGFKGRFLQIIGSSNATFSLRHYFNYSERRQFYKMIFPNIPIVGLPDYNSDEEWLIALDDLLMSHFGLNSVDEIKEKVTFLGGCEEDISFFLEDGRRVSVVNRFDGTTPKISATEVRDALIQGRDLSGLLNPMIANEVKVLFAKKWEKFKKI